jgi:hypothetical protein
VRFDFARHAVIVADTATTQCVPDNQLTRILWRKDRGAAASYLRTRQALFGPYSMTTARDDADDPPARHSAGPSRDWQKPTRLGSAGEEEFHQGHPTGGARREADGRFDVTEKPVLAGSLALDHDV